MKTKPRDALIIATKVSGPSHGWIKAAVRSGMTTLDRHNIVRAVEASLDKLQTDYIDLYQTHWPDHGARYEETLEALDELVRDGKVRVIGCSNETTWGLTKSLARVGDERLRALRNDPEQLQPQQPALRRRTRAGVPAGTGQPDSVFAARRAACCRASTTTAQSRKARVSPTIENAGARQAAMVKRFINEKTLASTARFKAIAEEAGMSVVTLATAWSKQHDFVASTIVGATRAAQLPEIFAAADLTLSADVMKKIDAVTKEILYPMG